MKKLLLSLWSLFYLWLQSEYKRYKGRPAALLKAIAKAKKLHLKTGHRYKVYFLENRYQCLTRADIQRKRRKGKEFLPHINATKLSAIAFFDTQTWQTSDFAQALLNTSTSLRTK